MTVGRTGGRATNQSAPVEGMGYRINLECRLLQLTANHLENPRNGRKAYEMWKARAQPGQKCPAKNAKCKDCHKIGHFYKVCQSKKRAKRANLVQAPPQNKQDTHINENGVRQPNPPMVNMLKIVNHIGTTSGSQEKHLKFPIDVDPRGPYKHHLVVRVDTGADVNCMNEKTFKKLFPKVKLYVPMRYRTLETQLQTFLYWVSFTPTCSSGEKST